MNFKQGREKGEQAVELIIIYDAKANFYLTAVEILHLLLPQTIYSLSFSCILCPPHILASKQVTYQDMDACFINS